MEFKNLKIKAIDCVLKYTPKVKHFSVNNRINHILGIQITGKTIHHFKDKNLNLDGGYIYFLNQKDTYSVDVSEIGTAFSVHFTTYEPIETDTFFRKINNTSEVIRMLELIEQNFLSKKDGLRLLSDFYSLCSYFNQIYEKTIMPKDIRMTNSEDYIKEHFIDGDCLEKSARISTLSRRRFNELFKSSFDITPNRYIINLKIEYAKRLLQTEYLNISQISEMCGFSDIYYFSRLFKREVGQTPLEYRKRNLSNN